MFNKIIFAILLSPMMLFAANFTGDIKVESNLDSIIKQHQFQLVGKTTFSVLFWDIYTSKLLTSSGKYPINKEKEKLIFEIKYLADISSEDLIERTEEQWQHIGVSSNYYQYFTPKLKNIWPDIVEGDTLSLLINKQESYFYFNQQFIGSIKSPEFGQFFIDIWLAENTSQPKLRKELLGK
jgi:hypothetical protein